MTAASYRVRPYQALYADIKQAMSEIPDFNGDLFLLMAVCVKESMGIQWFCKCDSLYRTTVGHIEQIHGKRIANEFVDAVTVRGGVNAGKIPKFRYHHKWYQLVKDQQAEYDISDAGVVVMACSYGLAGKAAIRLLPDAEPELRWLYADKFRASKDLQLTTLAHDLQKCGAFEVEGKESALWRYGYETAPSVMSSYGERVLDLAAELRIMYSADKID